MLTWGDVEKYKTQCETAEKAQTIQTHSGDGNKKHFITAREKLAQFYLFWCKSADGE